MALIAKESTFCFFMQCETAAQALSINVLMVFVIKKDQHLTWEQVIETLTTIMFVQ